jgi:putative transport protein
MEILSGLILGLPVVAQVMLMLCLVAVLGLGLGDLRFGGISIGIGGVLFAGIAVGHGAKLAGIMLDAAMLDFVREFGLILFVYSIGIQVGPGFFSALKRSGLALNLLAAGLVVMSVLTAVAIHLGAGLPLPVVLGLFSGAVTNTPSLGAAQQVLKEVGASPEVLGLPSLGYAMAYPFGIAGILLTMLGLRAVFNLDPVAAANAFDERRRGEVAAVETMNLMLRNADLAGRTIGDLRQLAEAGVIVSRMMRQGQLRVPHNGTRLEGGDILHLVGCRQGLERMQTVLGPQTDEQLTTKGTDLAWARVVVTNASVLGRSISALNVEDTHDVRISRVVRSADRPPVHADELPEPVRLAGRRHDRSARTRLRQRPDAKRGPGPGLCHRLSAGDVPPHHRTPGDGAAAHLRVSKKSMMASPVPDGH